MWTLLLLTNILVVSGSIQFAAFGDWGYESTSFFEVAELLHRNFAERDFTLLLGDNFYCCGVKDVNDSQFDIFTRYLSSQTSAPYHPVLGNHDYYGNVDAQVLYSNINPLWDMPHKFYMRVYESQGVKICMFMIDTVNLTNSQVDWLGESLSSPRCSGSSTWRIVSGHYPIWSAGGYNDSSELINRLLPILHTGNAHMYLCGHEHLHEIFWDGSLVQVVSGAVAEARDEIQFKQHPLLLWDNSGRMISGIVRVVALENELRISIIGSKGGRILKDISVEKTGENTISIRESIQWEKTTKSGEDWASQLVIVGVVILLVFL